MSTKQTEKDDTIRLNKNPNADKDVDSDKDKPSKSSPQPKKSAGKPVFDLPSQREGELFQTGDVAFFREGPGGDLKAIPKHEADERLVGIKERESIFRDHKTVTTLELADGTKVTIDGVTTTITPKKGPAVTAGPSLNVHHADIQG